MVSKDLIYELQEILAKEYSLDLSIGQVTDIANCLADYFSTLASISDN